MLVIRKRQMDLFNARLLERFERDQVRRVTAEFAGRAAELGAAGVRRLVHECVAKAESYGIFEDADVAMYLNLVFRFGEGFEDTAATAWMGEILRDDEMSGDGKTGLIAARLRARGVSL
jgi:muconolactone delta-isomerase